MSHDWDSLRVPGWHLDAFGMRAMTGPAWVMKKARRVGSCMIEGGIGEKKGLSPP